MMQIYKVVNKINGKWYIGKDVSDRPYYYGSGKALKNAIKKYGKNNFEKIILEICESKEHLIKREKHWIAVSGAMTDKMSYNIAAGGEGGDLSKHIDYKKRKIPENNFKNAKEWYENLTDDEKKAWHSKQGLSRSKVWYVSKIDQNDKEIKVTNIHQWSIENGCPGIGRTANKNHKLYGKACKGWRCRAEDDNNYPPYINKRKLGHPNVTCQGKSWKLVDGKRVWIEKQ